MKLLQSILVLLVFSQHCAAQFAAQAGLAGSTAISRDSSIIKGWAGDCSITRGWMDIADTTLGKTLQGDSSRATGYADADIVSLGDAGQALYYFDNPITDGPGFDFAIFENGFRDPLDSNMAYLELAKVAVSNDGINFYYFNAESHTDTLQQIAGTGTYMDCRKIRNLAGKYVTYFGTPFDLHELSGSASLDINNIRYVKVADVTGSLAKEFCSYDMNGMMINDPYPTPFPTGGFDLDALGVIHYKYPLNDLPVTNTRIELYPIPAKDKLNIRNFSAFQHVRVFTVEGRNILQGNVAESIDIEAWQPGIYFLQLTDRKGNTMCSRIQKL